MVFKFVAVLTGLTLLELVLLIQLGRWIGLLPTVLICVLTGLIGAWLTQLEGMETLQRLQQALLRGQFPGPELAEGAAVMFGGALLLTPGFLTDLVGFALIVPVARQAVVKELRRRWDLAHGIIEVEAVEVDPGEH